MSRFIDLTGKRFGDLTVIGVSEARNRGVLSWDCVCDCGVTKTIAGPELRNGQTKTCGCGMHRGRAKDITGKQKGSLTAIESTGKKSANGDYIWKFLCSCGEYCEKTIGNFNYKKNPKCGSCSAKEMLEVAEKRKTHGFSKNHKTYKAWCRIKERCYNKGSKDYETYGARGIGLQEELRADFLKFYAEVGEAPSDGKRWSIDRIDHTKDYEIGNMRWATDFQQARNKGKMKNNTTGVTGVSWDEKVFPNGKNSTTYACVQWKEYDSEGNQLSRTKRFSAKKLGLLPAFAEAVKFRKEIIQHLRDQGYEYAENHGE